jgi:hypothetical protein
MRPLTSFSFRHASSVSIAVLVAFIINYYFSFSGEFWLFLSAFLVSQTTKGTPLRQGLIYFLTIFVSLLFASALLMLSGQTTVVYPIVAIIYLFGSYFLFIYRPAVNRGFYFFLFFLIILLLGIEPPYYSFEIMQNRVLDIVLGSFIGIVASLVIFPVNFEREFGQGVIPVLTALASYSDALTQKLLLSTPERITLLGDSKRQVEKALQTQSGMYPEWAYEVGFNPGLRSGFRFFLVNLERLSDILFSMEYLSFKGEINTFSGLANEISKSMKHNQELILALTHYFDEQESLDSVSDFTSDIEELQAALHRLVTVNIEYLDLSPEAILLVEVVRDIKDMRQLLLQLVAALPERVQVSSANITPK